MESFETPLDLSSVTSALELGPALLRESMFCDYSRTYDEAEYRRLDLERAHRNRAASVQVGDQNRFLGGILCDSPVLDIQRDRTSLRVSVSEDWATCLAIAYADYVGNWKYSRCNPVLPVQFKFTGVSHLGCHCIDYDGGGSLLSRDCNWLLGEAQELLSTAIVSVSPDRVQLAMRVDVHSRKAHYPLVLIDAERFRIKDLRRRAWRRMFGAESLTVFDAADQLRWKTDGGFSDYRFIELFERLGLTPNPAPSRGRPKALQRFRRRKRLPRWYI